MIETHSKEELLGRIGALLEQDSCDLHTGELHSLIRDVLDNQATYLRAAEKFGTPQYLFDEARLFQQISRFQKAFNNSEYPVHTHYAFKANPSLCVVRAVHKAGINADVSSGLELDLALRCGFNRIVFSGPAKTDVELRLALQHSDRVTVHLDSFRELDRLEILAAEMDRTIDVGIRLNTKGHGLWTKFGIPLDTLPDLVQRARTASHLMLRGIQFHLSWNRNSEGYVRTLCDLGKVLRTVAPPNGWRFIDVGGGYYPEDDEAAYPWLTGRGLLLSQAGVTSAGSPPEDWDLRYLLHAVQPIETMAQDIFDAFDKHIRSWCDAELWLEPGRYLVNPAVHLLLGVVDVKHSEIAITDGGTNLLGWERLEAEHCPLINLSRPAETQRRTSVYGSLCTPHDLWGYTCYASDIREGDVLVVPAQGAYVQTLAQRFIKPICQTIGLNSQGDLRRINEEESVDDRYPELGRTSAPGTL